AMRWWSGSNADDPSAMPSCTNLELLGDSLTRAVAILTYYGDPPGRVAAVRSLLRGFRGADMPTGAARDMWVEILQSLLRTGSEAAMEELRPLAEQVDRLRGVIGAHLALTSAASN